MPRLAADLYASYHDSVLKLAAKPGGVSRPQIMEALNVSRSVADTMIEKCDLQVERREGRTEFFVPPGAAPPPPAPAPDVAPAAEKDEKLLPPEVEEAGVVEPNPLDRLAAVVEVNDEAIAAIDHEIADARTALRQAAEKAGKLMGEWATQQALVDALRERLQALAVRRMALTS